MYGRPRSNHARINEPIPWRNRLRALRYFASFALNVSLFLGWIPCAKLAKYRKAHKRFLRSAGPTCLVRLFLLQILRARRSRDAAVRALTSQTPDISSRNCADEERADSDPLSLPAQ